MAVVCSTGWVRVPNGIWGRVSVDFWGTTASGTAWLPFSNNSAKKVWENRRETKSPSWKGDDIIIQKGRRRRGGGLSPVKVNSERFLTKSVRVRAVPRPTALLSLPGREKPWGDVGLLQELDLEPTAPSKCWPNSVGNQLRVFLINIVLSTTF